MTHKQEQFNPEQEAILQYVPDFQTSTFTVTGLGEQLEPLAEEIKAMEAAAPIAPVAANKVPVTAPKPELAYEDFSTLPGRQIARMKVSSFLYDTFHGTNMLDLLNDRINDDRNVRFAREIGLLGVTRCAKHEKAVATLRRIM